MIPYADIDEAVLFRTRQTLFPGYVLRVKSHGQVYQFGLNPGRYWSSELPFPVRRESVPLGMSGFSIIVRVLAVAAFGYWIWHRFIRGD